MHPHGFKSSVARSRNSRSSRTLQAYHLVAAAGTCLKVPTCVVETLHLRVELQSGKVLHADNRAVWSSVICLALWSNRTLRPASELRNPMEQERPRE
jgi:hypothetical protein